MSFFKFVGVTAAIGAAAVFYYSDIPMPKPYFLVGPTKGFSIPYADLYESETSIKEIDIKSVDIDINSRKYNFSWHEPKTGWNTTATIHHLDKLSTKENQTYSLMIVQEQKIPSNGNKDKNICSYELTGIIKESDNQFEATLTDVKVHANSVEIINKRKILEKSFVNALTLTKAIITEKLYESPFQETQDKIISFMTNKKHTTVHPNEPIFNTKKIAAYKMKTI